MIEFAAVSPTVQATALIGFVALQAVALYIGYGVLTDAIASRVFGIIRDI